MDLSFIESRFWAWTRANAPSIESQQLLSADGLVLLLDCIKTGEITLLDSTQSPMSCVIRDHHNLDLFEMNRNWSGSDQGWVCPCCTRSKFQISRIGNKQQILAKLVVHHDHMADAMKQAFYAAFRQAGTPVEQVDGLSLVARMGSAFAAYEEVLICEDCNHADTEAKKIVSAPTFFSFSIRQISQFIGCDAHRPHTIDAMQVRTLWRQAEQGYRTRIALIEQVAKAAATDSHWYEPHPEGSNPVPVFGNRRGADNTIKRWVDEEALFDALAPKGPATTRNLSRWREIPSKRGKSLPANFLAILRSDASSARAWDAIAPDWHCSVCQRAKVDTVYVSDNGKVMFMTKSTGNAPPEWKSAHYICNHCFSTLMSIKLEISSYVEKPADSYSFISIAELASILRPRSVSPHLIDSVRAANLIVEIVARTKAS